MKVAVLDGSPEAGKAICEKLGQVPGYLATHYSTSDINSFLERLRSDLPDVLLLDIELPQLAGIEILSEIMHYEPIPVIVTCFPTQKGKLSVVQALELGAIDFITKPSSYFPKYLDDFLPKLIKKIEVAERINIKGLKGILESDIAFNVPHTKKTFKKDVVVLGLAKTALEAFRRLVLALPTNFPTILAITNLPGGYTKLFADRLNEITKVTVKEANERDELDKGHILIAPGGFHMKVNRMTGTPFIELSLSQKVNGMRPSVDVLMMSVAENIDKRAVGVLTSDEGEDGVVGLKSMKMAGADTIIFNPETAILSDRLLKAERFESYTHKVDFKDFSQLLSELI
jgi:two-component system chemotaxis response regulator CheB